MSIPGVGTSAEDLLQRKINFSYNLQKLKMTFGLSKALGKLFRGQATLSPQDGNKVKRQLESFDHANLVEANIGHPYSF
jgi:hypothetical protein